jgi:hypothetical protein
MTLTDTQQEAIATRVLAGEGPAVIARDYGSRVRSPDREAMTAAVNEYASGVLRDYRDMVAS